MADLVTRRVIEIDTKIAAGALQNLKSMDAGVTALEKSVGTLGSLLKGLAAGAIAGFSISAIFGSFKSALDDMDALNKQIQKVGISAESFQKLRFAAESSGVGTEQFNTSLVSLAKNMQGVDDATGKAGKALRAMGVNASDTNETALAKIADRFEKMPDGIRKTALAVQIFGKGAEDLIPLLNQGSEGLRAMGEQAERLGLVMSGQALAAADQLNSQFEIMGRVSKVVIYQLLEGLMPALLAVTGGFADATRTGEGFTGVGLQIGEMVLSLAGNLLKLEATLKGLAVLLAGIDRVSALAVRGDFEGAMTAMQVMLDTIKGFETETNTRLAAMRKRYEDALKMMHEPIKPKPTSGGGIDVTEPKPEDWETAIANIESQARIATQTLVLLGRGMPVDEAKELAAATDKLGFSIRGLDLSATPNVQKLFTGIDSMSPEMTLRFSDAIMQAAIAQKTLADEVKRTADLEAAYKAQLEAVAEEQKRINEQAGRELKEREDYIEKIRGDVESLAHPTAAIQRQIDEIGKAWEEGLVSFEDASQALNVLYKRMNDQTKSAADEWKITLLTAIEGFSKEASKSIVDFATGVESDFSKMATNIVRQVAEMVVNLLIMAPLFKAIRIMLGGMMGVQGGGYSMQGAQGAVFDQRGLVPFASGGIVDKPTMFPFANGIGLMGEAGPEAIMPLTRTSGGELGVRGGGAPTTNVYVINNSSGTTTKQQQQQRPDGGMDVRVMVEDAVDRGFARGRFDGTMQTQYGVNRKGRS